MQCALYSKSRAELSVLLVYRWILARLRHQRFFSLDELNAAIRLLLTELNDRPYQRLPGCRRSVFEALDRPAMRALPAAPYTYSEWRERMVAFDYHVDVEQHYYSVPHALVGHSIALEEQQQTPTVQSLSFEERIAMLIDRERLYRDNQRRTRLLRGARLKVAQACIEDINYKAARGSTSARSSSSPPAIHVFPEPVAPVMSRFCARRIHSPPARLRSRPADRVTRCFTGGCRASSRSCASRTAMAATSSS
jgi:hypothetical protein